MHFEEVKGVVVESLQKVKKLGILCFVEDSPAMWFMRQFELATEFIANWFSYAYHLKMTKWY